MEGFPPFLSSEFPPSSLDDATFAILPVPLEKTVSYGRGTSQGPAAILQASEQLEAGIWGCVPGAAGIATLPPLDCQDTMEEVLSAITHAVEGIIQLGKIPIVLGGEHSVSYGAIRAFADAGRSLGVVHFDAHADLRQSYEGSRFSHACVMHRVLDLGLPLVQVGVRDMCEEEVLVRKEHNVLFFDADTIADEGIPEPLLPKDFPHDIYISFDVDCFDASLMPATGTPQPGGLFWHDVRKILRSLGASRRIVGFDVVELAPIPGMHAYDFIAAKLTYLLMGVTLCSQHK
ncbi:MAG: agmatinase [Desulfovibrio sp.]|nr:agmatinase [Desulfovibrio sp.]